MAGKESTETDVSTVAELDVDANALFDVLSDPRRRAALACLRAYATPMTLGDVADEVATWERDAKITDVPAEDVNAVYLSLYHTHVPKMEAFGLVEYSQERDAVALTESGDELAAGVDLPSVG